MLRHRQDLRQRQRQRDRERGCSTVDRHNADTTAEWAMAAAKDVPPGCETAPLLEGCCQPVSQPTNQPVSRMMMPNNFHIAAAGQEIPKKYYERKNMKWKRFHSCCRNVTARRTNSHVLCVAFGLVDLHGASSKWTKRIWNLTRHKYPVKSRKLRRIHRKWRRRFECDSIWSLGDNFFFYNLWFCWSDIYTYLSLNDMDMKIKANGTYLNIKWSRN